MHHVCRNNVVELRMEVLVGQLCAHDSVDHGGRAGFAVLVENEKNMSMR